MTDPAHQQNLFAQAPADAASTLRVARKDLRAALGLLRPLLPPRRGGAVRVAALDLSATPTGLLRVAARGAASSGVAEVAVDAAELPASRVVCDFDALSALAAGPGTLELDLDGADGGEVPATSHHPRETKNRAAGTLEETPLRTVDDDLGWLAELDTVRNADAVGVVPPLVLAAAESLPSARVHLLATRGQPWTLTATFPAAVVRGTVHSPAADDAAAALPRELLSAARRDRGAVQALSGVAGLRGPQLTCWSREGDAPPVDDPAAHYHHPDPDPVDADTVHRLAEKPSGGSTAPPTPVTASTGAPAVDHRYAWAVANAAVESGLTSHVAAARATRDDGPSALLLRVAGGEATVDALIGELRSPTPTGAPS